MIKKILQFIIVVLVTVAVLCGCAGGGNGPDSTSGDTTPVQDTTTSETVSGPIALSGEVEYTIIRSEKAETEVVNLCSELWKKIYAMAGNTIININDDFVQNPDDVNNDEPEILVGLTNRPESAECSDSLPTYLDFSVKVMGPKIVITANTTSRLSDALDWFYSQLEMRDGVIYYNGGSIVVSYDGYKFKDLTVCGHNISEYVIKTCDSPSDSDIEFAGALAAWFGENTGYLPEVVGESAAECRVTISVAGKSLATGELKSGDYIIKTEDGNVVISAGGITGYKKAMEKIEKLISDSGNNTLASGIDEVLYETGVSIDGKKVAFIGNSFVYYGGCVELGDQRQQDYGIFYQICRANGENVTVYDFTYGGHRLRDFTPDGDKTGGSNSPGIGKDLLADVDLSDIDIVFISEAGENNANFVNDVKNVMKRFTKPGVQFVYVNHSYTCLRNHTNILNALPTLRKMGVSVVNWGQLAYDMIRRKAEVENSSFIYTQTTFIKNKGDTHHPNPLAGYITAQMCYTLVTGKSAVGQDYSFCSDRQFGGGAKGFDGFISTHYKSASDTNFTKIFDTESEMRGIQALIDEYVDKYK